MNCAITEAYLSASIANAYRSSAAMPRVYDRIQATPAAALAPLCLTAFGSGRIDALCAGGQRLLEPLD